VPFLRKYLITALIPLLSVLQNVTCFVYCRVQPLPYKLTKCHQALGMWSGKSRYEKSIFAYSLRYKFHNISISPRTWGNRPRGTVNRAATSRCHDLYVAGLNPTLHLGYLSFGWDRINWDLMSQQTWHVREPSPITARSTKHKSKCEVLSPVMVKNCFNR
jgi:hypothetical protein